MKIPFTSRTLALATSIALTLGCAPAFAAQLRTNERPVEGRYIVVLKENAARLSSEANGKARVPDIARTLSAGHGAKLLRSYEHALRGFVVDADDRALARLLADPRVAYVEEDGFVSASATQSPATWGLDRVDQRNLPLDNAYTYTTAASGVHAYIIDTGMLTTHSQFGGRIGNGFDAVGGGVTDCNGHGTHVAGTVGGATWGVTKSTTLHPVRVLDCGGSGTWSGVIAGLDWVRVNHVKPAVANMSLGGGANASVDAATDNLIAAGVTVVVAAGNDYGGDACAKSPARVAAAITVGSTDSNDARSSFSNIGTCLDLFAPGGGITSAWHTSTTASNTISGTSMASPHVAGAAALYLADNPSASPAAVRNALVANATPNKVTNAGAGSPNLLLYTINSAPPPPGCGVLASGASLPTGGSKTSCDGRFTFVIQGDGNLVLYQAGVGAIWANHVYGTGHTLHMQGDGNLVVYNSTGQARWHTNTWGQPGAWLAVQNDGNVVVYSATGQALWNTGTWGR